MVRRTVCRIVLPFLQTEPEMHRKKPAGWPFWLLLAAWCCVNVPPAATCGALDWMIGAAHFSHQARLKAAVARILSGGEKPAALARAKPAPVRLPPPAALPGPLAKKADLCLAPVGPPPAGLAGGQFLSPVDVRTPDPRQGEPPDEPPRRVRSA